MGVGKMQYVTVNDSRIVASGFLEIGGTIIPLESFEFREYANVQRKVLLGWCCQSTVMKYGRAVSSQFISSKSIVLDVAKSNGVLLDIGVEKILLESMERVAGKYTLRIDICLDIPLEALGDVPEHVMPLVQYSEILNVLVSMTPSGEEAMPMLKKPRPVYDGYGQLGFFLADLQKMNDYIVARLGAGKINLKDAFCETEIANELFEEGLLVLVWGMTPWHYYIYGLEKAEDAKFLPVLPKPQFQGRYRLRSDIQNPSVVPGEFLLNWPDCLDMEFPKLSLGGEGELLSVGVHVQGFYVPGVGIGPRLSVIVASRGSDEPIIEPLLMVDIESVEARLGF